MFVNIRFEKLTENGSSLCVYIYMCVCVCVGLISYVIIGKLNSELVDIE